MADLYFIPLPVPKHLDIVVSSCGGAGTTMLMHFLSNHKKINNITDNDGLKHPYRPPVSANSAQKFIYVYSNPIHAAISLFRRKIYRHQSIKTQRGNRKFNTPIPVEMTLDEYEEQGHDRFGFRDHFYSWYNSSIQNPIMFIRYESIFDHLESIIHFAGLSTHILNDFPQQKPRESLNENVSERTVELLEKMHEQFLMELETLPDLEIRDGNDWKFKNKLSLNPKYYSSYTLYGLKK